MGIMLGPVGSEVSLPDPEVYTVSEIPIGASMRAWDGTFHQDYSGSADAKRLFHLEWRELTEDQTTGTNGVITKAPRTQMLHFRPPDWDTGFIDVYIGEHPRNSEAADFNPVRWNIVLEFEEK